MFNEGGSVVIVNCTFASNIVRHYGGGIYNAGGSLFLENCIFCENEAYGEEWEWTGEAEAYGTISKQEKTGIYLI